MTWIERHGSRIAALGALALILLVFARAVRFPFLHWDDGLHVTENPLTAHPLCEGWRQLFLTRRLGYPIPVLVLSFALDRLCFGLTPAFFHAENVILHAINAALVARLGERTGLSRRAAIGAAALFAVHPLVVEPVCWVTGRKDVLSAAFLLLALLIAATPGPRRAGSQAGTVLLAACAMLTKPSAIVAPVLLVLVQRRARPDLRWKDILLPAGLVAGVSAAIGTLGLAGEGGVGAVRAHSTASAVRDAAGALAIQLQHLVLPVGLLPRYFRVDGDPPVWSMLVAGCAVAAVAVVSALAVSPRSPIRFGLLFAAIAYLPVSGAVDLNRWFADSYMYLPLVGLSLAAAALAFDARSAVWPRARLVLSGAALIGLAILSSRQVTIWSSSSNLWPAVVARYPTVPRAWALQASGDLADGRAQDAEDIYVRLRERFPDYDGAIVNQVYAYDRRGDLAADRDVWRRCLELAKEQCVEVFWRRVLEAREPPDPARRELYALAFDKGAAIMKSRFHDAAAWRRFSEALRGLGLDDEARRSDDVGRRLE